MSTHLFVIDPIEALNLEMDTSMALIRALLRDSQQEVWICHLDDLLWQHPQEVAHGRCRQARLSDQDALNFEAKSTSKALSDFEMIYVRKDPPFDMSYVYLTWMLESSEAHGSIIVNRPRALRGLNEKLSTLLYPDFCLPSLVSNQPDDLYRYFSAECKGDAIVKPLDLFGGRGIERISLGKGLSTDQVWQKLAALCHDQSPRLIQPFRNEVFAGEVRCVAIGGRAMFWTLKKPADGEFLANTRAGATLHPYDPSPQEQRQMDQLSSLLLQEGVYFAGYDLIAGKVSEINLTSPRLLCPPGKREEYHQRCAEALLQLTKG